MPGFPSHLAASTAPSPNEATDEVHSFMRGASHRVEVAPSENGIRITGSGFRQNEFLEVRSIFPASLVPDATASYVSPLRPTPGTRAEPAGGGTRTTVRPAAGAAAAACRVTFENLAWQARTYAYSEAPS